MQREFWAAKKNPKNLFSKFQEKFFFSDHISIFSNKNSDEETFSQKSIKQVRSTKWMKICFFESQ